MYPGKDLAPAEWGRRVLAAAPGRQRGGPLRLTIWQGLADSAVAPRNADELMEQWTNAFGIASTVRSTERLPDASVHLGASSDGSVLIEQVMVSRMAHGMAIDPANGCGSPAPFILDQGLCASGLIAQFWGIAD
jgi:feruloyl esterase